MTPSNALWRLLAPLVLVAAGACDDGPAGDAPTGPVLQSAAQRVFTQRERLGNPLVSEVMIVKAHHHAHNLGQPSSDPAEFTDNLVTFITGTAGRDPAYASAIAGALLPDMLIAYPKRDGTPVFWLSWVFGHFGGRSLSDDVVDIGLGALFGSLLGNTNNVTPGLTTDNVGANDVTFLTGFPYLSPGN
jgi:hypothetical protein